MIYSRKDLLADLLLVMVIGLVGSGTYLAFKPSFAKVIKALGEKPERSRRVAVGTAADYQWSAQTLDGRTVAMSSLKGKVVFLNFWATWCGPCLMELPSIQKLYEQFKDADIAFVCLSDENLQQLNSFVRNSKLKVPVYRTEKMPESFRVTVLPTTFILSRSGKVALSHTGAAIWNKKKVVELMKTLLGEPAT